MIMRRWHDNKTSLRNFLPKFSSNGARRFFRLFCCAKWRLMRRLGQSYKSESELKLGKNIMPTCLVSLQDSLFFVFAHFRIALLLKNVAWKMACKCSKCPLRYFTFSELLIRMILRVMQTIKKPGRYNHLTVFIFQNVCTAVKRGYKYCLRHSFEKLLILT